MRPVRKSQPWIVAAAAAVGALVLAATGCGAELSCSGGETTITTGAPTTITTVAPITTAPVPTAVPATGTSTTTAGAPTTTTTTEALSSAETRLANGDIRGMGFIDIVWEAGGVRYLSIDYAEMLTGEEARQAAIDAGEIQPDEDLPNDYFIRNVNPQKREFTVSPSVVITTATRSGGFDEPATWGVFKSFWSGSPPAGAAHLQDMPWWIVRRGAEVITIDEQYIP
jgi:hypothetical protein